MRALVGSGLGADGAIGVAQSGVKAAGFGAGAYFAHTNGGPDITTGHSVVLLFDNPAGTSAAHQVPLGNYDGTTGWYIDVQTGVPMVMQQPGAVAASSGVTLVTGPGPHCIAFAVTGGNIRISVDGSLVVAVAVSGTYASPGASAICGIGAGNAGATPWPGGVYHVKAYARALSDTELYTFSAMGIDNRYSLPAAATGDTSLTLDARPSRDWNGVAGTWTSLGSSPVTFTVTGSPTLSTVSEQIITRATFLSSMIDGVQGIAQPIAYGRLKFRTPDAVFYVDCTPTAPNGQDIVSSVYQDDTYLTAVAGPDGTNPVGNTYGAVRQCSAVTKTAGSHIIDVADGPNALSATPIGAINWSRVSAIRTSVGGFSPITQPPVNRIVGLGDSIMIGGVSTQNGKLGWFSLLRDQYRTLKANAGAQDVVGMTCHAASGESLWDLVTNKYGSVNALASTLVTLANQVGSGQKWILDCIDTNDYSFSASTGNTAAQWGTLLGSLYDAIYALDPTIKIMAKTMFITTLESTANSKGDLPSAFRTQKTNVGNARSSFVTVFGASATISAVNITGGNVHPNNAGHAQVPTPLRAAFPFG